MIDSRNVQRGNVVLYENKYYKIDTISEEHPYLDTIEFGVNVVEWKDLQPVEITKEVLEKKIGFVKINEGSQHGDRYEVYAIPKCYIQIIFFKHLEVFYKGVFIENIKYIHQLQNLYNLTTETELNFEI
jgi:hypothetical protein